MRRTDGGFEWRIETGVLGGSMTRLGTCIHLRCPGEHAEYEAVRERHPISLQAKVYCWAADLLALRSQVKLYSRSFLSPVDGPKYVKQSLIFRS